MSTLVYGCTQEPQQFQHCTLKHSSLIIVSWFWSCPSTGLKGEHEYKVAIFCDSVIFLISLGLLILVSVEEKGEAYGLQALTTVF